MNEIRGHYTPDSVPEVLSETYVVRREDGYYLAISEVFKLRGYHSFHLWRFTFSTRPRKDRDRWFDKSLYVDWHNFYEECMHDMTLEDAQAAAITHGGKIYKVTTLMEEYGV